jgi:hypothetical protein
MTASPLTLLREAAGGPRAFASKLARLGRAIARAADRSIVDERLERLARAGVIDAIPTPLQRVVGSIDMLRWWIVPAAADYYRARGLDFGFHQTLRWLEEPASMVDPLGLCSTRENVIGHLMQVVHANPVYDLQLLEAHDGGLEELEAQLVAMVAGRHPRARSIGAVVEEGDYHRRLLDFVRAYRRDRDAAPPLRSNVSRDPRWIEIERTFGTLPAAMRYASSLPREPSTAAAHVISHAGFPARGQR